MNDKTEQLRDIFLDVADDDSVTESQQEGPGSLVGGERSPEQVRSVLARMRETFDLGTELDDETLWHLVRLFYTGVDDAAIGDEIGCSADTVFRARMDLHLVRDEDLPGERLARRLREAESAPDSLDAATVSRLADRFDTGERAVERAGAAVAAVDRSRRVSHRYRTAFEESLTDIDLTLQLTDRAREDGLKGATADAEVGVEF